jgi:5-methyltetrahydrofolate--homocysteine methyltransferase
MNNSIKEILKKPLVILDGAMGTMLLQSGVALGKYPEVLCFTHADIVENIHKQYVDAGADIIYANTFGANRKKLEGSDYSCADIINAAIKIAKKAAQGTDTKVALSIGSIGELLKPVGTLSFEEAYDIFKEMVIAGEAAGADLVVFETMMDLNEVKAGVLATKENTSLPVFASMTYEKTGRTFMGCSVESMAETLGELGADAVGINCSLGPEAIFPIAKKLVECSKLPVFIKANAGLPDPFTGQYDVSAEQFALQMKEYTKIGVHIMGGCCGTSPEYIKQIIHQVA